jgi:hypothetical protein
MQMRQPAFVAKECRLPSLRSFASGELSAVLDYTKWIALALGMSAQDSDWD